MGLMHVDFCVTHRKRPFTMMDRALLRSIQLGAVTVCSICVYIVYEPQPPRNRPRSSRTCIESNKEDVEESGCTGLTRK